jgi:hypothetical protein
MVAGSALTAAGFAWFAMLTPTTSWLAGILGPGIAVSLGMGLVFPAVTTAATSGVDASNSGLVSGLVTTSRQVGGAIGLSVLSTLAVAHSSTVLATGAPEAVAATAGTTRAFAVAAGVVLLAAVAALAVPARRTPGEPERPPVAPDRAAAGST